jgi:hypothetical protein
VLILSSSSWSFSKDQPVAASRPGTTPVNEAASLHREDQPYTTSLDVTE